MFRQQLTGNGMLSVGKALYHEGFRLLFAYSNLLILRYRGIGAPIMQKTLSTSLMFGTYDFYRHSILSAQRRVSGYVVLHRFDPSPEATETVGIRLAASSLSGLTEALLTPFERVQTLLQIPRYNTRFTNFFDACHQLGLRESFTGFSSSLIVLLTSSAVALRNCIGSGLFLFFRDPIKRLLPQSSSPAGSLYPASDCSDSAREILVIVRERLFVCLFAFLIDWKLVGWLIVEMN